MSYIAFFLLIGCLWLISNSSYYFTYQSKGIGFSIITLVIALILVYPPSKYFIKISAFQDYDFINIFIQGAILKSVIFGIVITIAYLGIYICYI